MMPLRASLPCLLWVATVCSMLPGCSGDDGQAPACVPSCAERQCGTDGCGGSCGTCPEGASCDPASGVCGGCVPDCSAKQCGADGCGGDCGACQYGAVCNPYYYECVGGCIPDCGDRVCGSDGCDGGCGTCVEGISCIDGQCVVGPSCQDDLQNGLESDVDCGGDCEKKCLGGRKCVTGPDCASGTCGEDGTCQMAATCSNGDRDPGESDTDCGGECLQCALDQMCQGHDDCLSMTCFYGRCATPSCDDELKNAKESDVDCGGGDCDPCADGRTCREASDCDSNRCDGNTGTCWSCDDNRLNGNESDVDCGGSCGPCDNGKTCGADKDCEGGGCEEGRCCTVNSCGICWAAATEVCDGKDNDCDGKTDDALPQGSLCPLQKGVCAGYRESCSGALGWLCNTYGASYQETETSCTDGKDNDCDGLTDYADKPGCCLPECDGKTCGDDGCGGDCGTCDNGWVCQSGTCALVCGGDSNFSCKFRCGTSMFGIDCRPEGCPGSNCPPDFRICCPA